MALLPETLALRFRVLLHEFLSLSGRCLGWTGVLNVLKASTRLVRAV